jgi:hypothetical protein
MEQRFTDWLLKRENYGGSAGDPSSAMPGPDGFGTSVPTTAMNTYINSEKPPTAKDRMTKIKKMKKDCGCKKDKK